ncbi:DNA methyltransferase [Hafnia paralvei]|uniref:DNA methyltransferase n=1 Tax=Hafnia paralvei TaxID=546367 RepID=UPI003969D087
MSAVWICKLIQLSRLTKRPCEKPIVRDIIAASSKPGDVVSDFFMGSGSTIKEAIKLGRYAVGVELEKERFDQTESEILALMSE